MVVFSAKYTHKFRHRPTNVEVVQISTSQPGALVLILTTSVTIVCITQFGQKVDCEFWSEFEKKNQKQKQNQNQTKQNK